VESNGPAAHAELQPGYLIAGIDGQNTPDLLSAAGVLAGKKKGDSAELTVTVRRQPGRLVRTAKATSSVRVPLTFSWPGSRTSINSASNPWATIRSSKCVVWSKALRGPSGGVGPDFSVGRGEIVGFLGPNGAGKSTTSASWLVNTGHFRFSACAASTFLHKTHEVRGASVTCRRTIRCTSKCACANTSIRARLKGVGHPPQPRACDVVMQQCGLTEVSGKSSPSFKGYRQRVASPMPWCMSRS